MNGRRSTKPAKSTSNAITLPHYGLRNDQKGRLKGRASQNKLHTEYKACTIDRKQATSQLRLHSRERDYCIARRPIMGADHVAVNQ